MLMHLKMNFLDYSQMQNKIFFLLFICSFQFFLVKAQNPLLSDMTQTQKENVGYYLQFLEESYYYRNFTHPDNLSQLLSFCKNEKSLSYTYKDSIILRNDNDTIFFLYKDTIFFKYKAKILTCNTISEQPFYQDFVALYDAMDNCFYEKKLLVKWQHKLHIVYSNCSNGNYYVVRMPDDSVCPEISNKPKLFLYQFDIDYGLSLHSICADSFAIHNSSYISQLTKLSKKICKKYKAKKIIFSAYMLNDNKGTSKN